MSADSKVKDAVAAVRKQGGTSTSGDGKGVNHGPAPFKEMGWKK